MTDSSGEVNKFTVTLDECDVDMACIEHGMKKAFRHLIDSGVESLDDVEPSQWIIAFAIARIAYDAELARKNFGFANIGFSAQFNNIETKV